MQLKYRSMCEPKQYVNTHPRFLTREFQAPMGAYSGQYGKNYAVHFFVCLSCTAHTSGDSGHCGIWDGHQQAQRPFRAPPHHQQVHGELLPGER